MPGKNPFHLFSFTQWGNRPCDLWGLGLGTGRYCPGQLPLTLGKAQRQYTQRLCPCSLLGSGGRPPPQPTPGGSRLSLRKRSPELEKWVLGDFWEGKGRATRPAWPRGIFASVTFSQCQTQFLHLNRPAQTGFQEGEIKKASWGFEAELISSARRREGKDVASPGLAPNPRGPGAFTLPPKGMFGICRPKLKTKHKKQQHPGDGWLAVTSHLFLSHLLPNW